MTLVPARESGNKDVKTLDERRIYEVIGGGDGETSVTDFEGRVLTRSGSSLKIGMPGKAAQDPDATAITKPTRVAVRLRFTNVRSAKVNGSAAKVQQVGDASVMEFELTKETVVSW